MEEYNVTNRNKVKRVAKRASYDKESVYRVLDDSFLCHVSFVVEGQPFIIPTIYGRKGNTLFLHGATTSRMIKTLQEGVDMSLGVTHLDGIVLARSAFHHSANYRSVVVFGKALLVEEEQKEEALYVISEQVLQGRWDEVRKPNARELKATTILAVDIEEASVKIRQGGPIDDKEDYELNIWAGVVPLAINALSPISDDFNQEMKVSDSVRNYLKNHFV
ncbi:pyridoxamine 5'-phosphate oxidase family protein [Fulvivirga sediminis]|uniref:Pyridoxamine 5'-phosphate oxidase family protein n=1 Tax=Fulvivirga sediminis TaxID=2803949 RepID=A0A937F898_9BACT|nr:pyridoxamine 5'-phosphate oxidase family protein [Fulvivirga sediminis]MBL3656429.1 pyridoxamine 5'-phosphate oxidase family protein [Fulvivirga sediminis]